MQRGKNVLIKGHSPLTNNNCTMTVISQNTGNEISELRVKCVVILQCSQPSLVFAGNHGLLAAREMKTTGARDES